MKIASGFSQLARRASLVAGHPSTFLTAVLVVAAWALTGPIFGFSDTWQLVINTGTTIVTFLMVFLIQNSQNRDTTAVHVKLDELVRAVKEARNSVIALEDLDEAEVNRLLTQYQKLGEKGRNAARCGSQPDQTLSAPGPAGDGSGPSPLDE